MLRLLLRVKLLNSIHHGVDIPRLVEARMLRVDDLAFLVDQVTPAVGQYLPLVECPVVGSSRALPVTQQVEWDLKLPSELSMTGPPVKADAKDLGITILEELVVVTVPGQLALSNRREVRRIEDQHDVLRPCVVFQSHRDLILTLHTEIRRGVTDLKTLLGREL